MPNEVDEYTLVVNDHRGVLICEVQFTKAEWDNIISAALQMFVTAAIERAAAPLSKDREEPKV